MIHMKIKTLFSAVSLSLLAACNTQPSGQEKVSSKDASSFNVFAESFADLQVLRYEVPGFEQLTAKEKELVYYLYEAAMCGRDIITIKKVSMVLHCVKPLKRCMPKVVKGMIGKNLQIIVAAFGSVMAITITMATKSLFPNAVPIILKLF